MEIDRSSKSKQTLTRRSYLMRLWRDHPEAPWRVLLQEVGSDEQHKFPSWEAFQHHVTTLMAEET